jgi:hypothetical protein
MLRNASTRAVRPHVPTLAERRRAELLGLPLPSQREQHTQPPEPDPYPPPPPAESSLTPSPAANPKLGEAALHGLAGLAVRTIAPHTEALTVHSEPTGGRPSTLWSASEEDEHEENKESVEEDQEPAEEE